MANLPIRYTCSFKSTVESLTGSNEYTIQILDENLGGDLNLELTTDARGFTLRYEGDDKEFQDILKPSYCTIPMMVQDAQDLGFVDLLINTQEQRFYIEILKNGSPFWRGPIYQGEFTEEIAPIPFVFEIRAGDGLSELREVFQKGAFNGFELASINERIIYALTQTQTDNLFTDEEKYLTTCFRWFEDSMPSALVDPGAYTSFNDKNYSYVVDDLGEEQITDSFTLLGRLLKYWNARIMQVNGSWLVSQVNEWTKTDINTFTYSREYRTIGQPPPDRPGILTENELLEVQKKLESGPGFDFIKETGAVYEYLGALKSVEVDYDYEIRRELYKRINGDFTTIVNTNQVTATGVGLGLNIFGTQTVKIEDTVSPSAIYNITITITTTIKVGSNWFNGTGWQGTPATVSTTFNDKLEPALGAQLFYIPFSYLTSQIPVQDDLELQFVTSVASTTGVTPTPVITDEFTTVTAEYDDPTGNNLIKSSFKVNNLLEPNSSLTLTIDDVLLGDLSSSGVQNQNYIIYPNSNSNIWQKELIGDQVSINLLLARELMFNRKKPRKKFEFSMRGAFSAHFSLLFDSRIFIINGGEFTARSESFDGTYLELNYSDGDISSEVSDDNTNDDQNATFSIVQGLNGDINDRERWRGEYLEGSNYQINDQTVDNGWLGVVTNPNGTNDSPAPQLLGDKSFAYEETPTWGNKNDADYIQTGNRYKFTAGGFVTAVRAYTPVADTGITYNIIVINRTNPLVPVYRYSPEFLGTNDGWVNVQLGIGLVKENSIIDVILLSRNSNASTSWNHTWDFEAVENNNGPSSENWNRRNQNNIIRISDTDNTSTDRSTELEQITPGTTIVCEDNATGLNTIEYQVVTVEDKTTYFEFQVNLISVVGDIPPGTDTKITATIPTPQGTDYVDSFDYWLSNSPEWASVEGLVQIGGGAQTVNDTGYGTDLEFQEAVVSEDYDLQAYTDIGAAVSALITGDFGGLSGIQGGTVDISVVSGEYYVKLLQPNTYTLPQLVNLPDKSRFVNIKNVSGGSATLETSGGDTLDGNSNPSEIADRESFKYRLTDNDWEQL